MTKLIIIPEKHDDPYYLLKWRIDDLGPLVVGLLVGMMIEKALICTLIGAAFTGLFRKYRENNPDGYPFHLIYRLGFLIGKGRNFPSPFIKTYFP